MKKLGLTFAAIGLFFATTAQAQEETQVSTEVTTEVTTQNQEFVKVEISELPEAVSTAVSTDFAEANVTEAWSKEKNAKVIYKIKLDVNGEEKTVYADAEGNWLKKEDTHNEE